MFVDAFFSRIDVHFCILTPSSRGRAVRMHSTIGKVKQAGARFKSNNACDVFEIMSLKTLFPLRIEITTFCIKTFTNRIEIV